jgi:hypothetical protein
MTYENETTPHGQAAHAETLYKSVLGTVNPSAYAAASIARTEVDNDDLGGLDTPYDGTKVIAVAANRAGVDAYPEDTQEVEDLEMEVLVNAAAYVGGYSTGYAIFDRGGPVGDFTASNYQSGYMDALWLAERSKQTGVKHF